MAKNFKFKKWEVDELSQYHVLTLVHLDNESKKRESEELNKPHAR